jgi:hypothetical protein
MKLKMHLLPTMKTQMMMTTPLRSFHFLLIPKVDFRQLISRIRVRRYVAALLEHIRPRDRALIDEQHRSELYLVPLKLSSKHHYIRQRALLHLFYSHLQARRHNSPTLYQNIVFLVRDVKALFHHGSKQRLRRLVFLPEIEEAIRHRAWDQASVT